MVVGFQCDGNWMYSSLEDGTVKIWDLRENFRASGCQREYESCAAFNTVVLQPNQTMTNFEPLHKLQAHNGYILKCLLSPELCDPQRFELHYLLGRMYMLPFISWWILELLQHGLSRLRNLKIRNIMIDLGALAGNIQKNYLKLGCTQGWFCASLFHPSSRNIAQLTKVKIMKQNGQWEDLCIPRRG